MDAHTVESKREASAESCSVGSMTEEMVADQTSGNARLRLSAAGAGALLFDPGTGDFDVVTQRRLQALAKRIEITYLGNGATEVVPGVNNVMFLFDPLELHPDEAASVLLRLWETTDPESVSQRLIEIPVVYGGKSGEDLVALSETLAISVEEYVRRHSEATYTVACIGSMPGFAYMTGLPTDLAVPRRQVPRMKVEIGSVIIGGAQAGVMPCTAPSGWHLLGRTTTRLFDTLKSPPCLFAPGDQVRFAVEGIEA